MGDCRRRSGGAEIDIEIELNFGGSCDRMRQEAFCPDERFSRRCAPPPREVIIVEPREHCRPQPPCDDNLRQYYPRPRVAREPNYYHNSNGYRYGCEQPAPSYYRQGPTYSRDSVHGGRDGYSADRQRYNGGYTQRGGYGGGYNYDQGIMPGNDFDRVTDFALKGFDAWAGYDIARRHAKGQYSNNNGFDAGGRRNMRHGWQR